MLRRENYYAAKKQEQIAARFLIASDDVINNLKTSTENKKCAKKYKFVGWNTQKMGRIKKF